MTPEEEKTERDHKFNVIGNCLSGELMERLMKYCRVVSDATVETDRVFMAPCLVLLFVQLDEDGETGQLFFSNLAVPPGVPLDDVKMVLRAEADALPEEWAYDGGDNGAH